METRKAWIWDPEMVKDAPLQVTLTRPGPDTLWNIEGGDAWYQMGGNAFRTREALIQDQISFLEEEIEDLDDEIQDLYRMMHENDD